MLIFIFSGAIAEIPYSLIVNYGEVHYGGGSSGGIFALIAAFLVCYLRFPNEFNFKKFRLDLVIVCVYFVLANDNLFSFLTHVFGFSVGILIATIMVISKVIKSKPQSMKFIKA